MTYKNITVYIDGQKTNYEGILDNTTFHSLAMTGISGSDGIVNEETNIVFREPFGTVWALAIWGEDENGAYWDIDGLYGDGEFGKMEDGTTYYSVKGRIA